MLTLDKALKGLGSTVEAVGNIANSSAAGLAAGIELLSTMASDELAYRTSTAAKRYNYRWAVEESELRLQLGEARVELSTFMRKHKGVSLELLEEEKLFK